jgi:molybdate transport system substrate-binding protein
MTNNLLRTFFVLGCILFLTGGVCAAQTELSVFAAASLTGVSEDLKAAFTEEYPDYTTQWNLAGTQELKTQVENGATPDVFISASARYTREMTEDGWFIANSVSELASNWIIVIVPTENPAGITSLADLANPGVMIAMGNEDVPVGINTRSVIDKIAALEEYGSEWKDAVFENTVTYELSEPGVVEKVKLGEVDAGFVYQSSYSAAKDTLSALEIAKEQNEIQYYSIALLAESKSPYGAVVAFEEFMLGEVGQAILVDFGFTPAS